MDFLVHYMKCCATAILITIIAMIIASFIFISYMRNVRDKP